jgi:hypothetical protein
MFFLDLIIAVAALLVLSIACGTVWAAFKGVQIVVQGGDTDPASMMRALGEPGAIAMIWMTLIGTGGAALLVYAWRRRATRVERAVSARAARRIGTWGWVAVAAAATFTVSSALGFVGQHFGIKPQPTNLAVIEAAFAASPVFMLLFGILIAPDRTALRTPSMLLRSPGALAPHSNRVSAGVQWNSTTCHVWAMPPRS